jgi:RHS repeat-associated protein
MDGPYSHGYEYDYWGNLTHRYGWGGEVQGGGAGQTSDIYYYYDIHNHRTGFSYDNAGNLTFDGGQNFTYDATGQQTNASYSGYSLQQSYDCDRLRVKKVENGSTTYYLRSTVLGGQVVAEINWYSVAWGWTRGYVYAGSQLLAVQQGGVNWMHEDPITKSKRVTNSAGSVVSTIELDPWGADTSRSSNGAFQPKKFTSYDRDGNGTDEAMFRRYNRWHSRFDQPDPSSGSYDLTNPQSFNRYSYVQNDPVNFVDPSGLFAGPAGVGCGYFDSIGSWIQTDCSVGGFNDPRWKLIQSPRVGDPKSGGLSGGSGASNPQETGTPIPARNLLPEVFHLLDNNRCFTFISNLLDVARQMTGQHPYTYDAYQLAVAIATQRDGGITFYPGNGGGDVSGDIFSGQARVGIYLRQSGPNMDPVGTQVYYALVALHEFIHAAGGADQYGAPIYSDYLLAAAARILTGAPGYPARDAPKTRQEQDALRADTGDYWDRQLSEHCKP